MSYNKGPNSPKNKSGKKMYHQGVYQVKNVDKYLGDPTKVTYRSQWELKFMIYLDHNISIHKWSSEFITIPYQDKNGKFHRYYPDFYIEKINTKHSDIIDRWVIEMKPSTEISPKFIDSNGGIIPAERFIKKMTPSALESYEYQLKTYQKNLYKWTKAKVWCEKNGMAFKLLDEQYLKKIGVL